jgi:NADPH-dependent 2,4-dienoyl-CoA reductase/sulfur reductase-like enzyme
MNACDVAIVGAGPAGLAAATACADAGLDTVVFDEQSSPGGQIYRAIGHTPLTARRTLGEDYWRGARLVDAFLASKAHHVPSAAVWSVTPELEVGVRMGGGTALVQARRVILATGAQERPFPIPGWTLPGVMNAGAAQILLKSSGLVPAGPTVLAGCGPLLWLLARQYLDAGARIDAILDTTPARRLARTARHVLPFLRGPYAAKGLRLLHAVRRHVRVVGRVTHLAAMGEDRVEAVAYRRDDGSEATLPADHLLLHHGVVPNVNLALAAGIEHRWDDATLCWTPVVDAFGTTPVQGIAIAGDGAGIAGAEAAEQRGLLAAIAAIRALRPGAPAPDELRVRTALARQARGRAFLDALYRPAPQFRVPRGETIVCRCEEVTAAQVLDATARGCPGPNQLKAFLRCGMGPCQGRLCGLTVTELMAQAHGASPQAIGHYRIRPPVKPVTVAELATLPKTDDAVAAVVRI